MNLQIFNLGLFIIYFHKHHSFHGPDETCAECTPQITKEIHPQCGLSGCKPSKFERAAARNDDTDISHDAEAHFGLVFAGCVSIDISKMVTDLQTCPLQVSKACTMVHLSKDKIFLRGGF